MGKREKKKKEQHSERVLPTESSTPKRPPAHVVLWDEPPKGDVQEESEDEQTLQ